MVAESRAECKSEDFRAASFCLGVRAYGVSERMDRSKENSSS
jgi:hypothetical protein